MTREHDINVRKQIERIARESGDLSVKEHLDRMSGDAYDFALYLFVPDEEEERALHQAVVFGPKGHMEEGWKETGVYGEFEVSVLAQTGDIGVVSRRPLEAGDMLALITWLSKAVAQIGGLTADEAEHGSQG